MMDVRATFGPAREDAGNGRPSYLVLRARHASQTPECHRCILNATSAPVSPRFRCRPRLGWIIPAFVTGVIGLAASEGARAAIGAAFGSALGALPARPSIDLASTLFPQAVPGFDQEQGLTLPSAPPIDDSSAGRGVRAGSVFVQPSLDLGVGFDSNVLGARGRPGSAVVSQAPAVSITTDGSSVRAGAFFDIENATYLDQPRQSRTDFKAAVGATANIGRHSVTFGYSHLRLHDDPAAVGSIASSEPTPFDVDDVRLSGRIELGRLSLLPFTDYSHWSYGSVRIGGIQTDQSFRNRSLLQAGSAARLMIGERRDLLASLSFISTQYDKDFGTTAAPSSSGVLALGGVDFELDPAVRARVLLGIQARAYRSSLYRNQVVTVGQVALSWLPQKQTEVSLALSRSLEDLAQEDPGGTIFTRAELAIRHEYWRNLVLRARTGVTSAEFLQLGGTQASGYVGGGFEWDINRHWRLVGDAQVARVSSPIRTISTGVQGVPSGPYTRVQTGLHLVTAL